MCVAETNGRGLLPQARVCLGCWSAQELAIGFPGAGDCGIPQL